MLSTILLTALSTQLTFVTPLLPQAPQSPQVVLTQVLPEKNYVNYVVQPDDTLKSIALAYYGSEDAWSVLAKDNPGIVDPDNLAAGSSVKIIVNTKNTQSYSLQKSDPSANPVSDDLLVPTALPTMQPTQAPVSAVSVAPVPTIAVSSSASISEDALNYLGNCEAGMNPARNSGNGYYGAFQFSYGTWKSLNTGYERADLAPLEVQKAVVRQLLNRSSIYSQFPGCAHRMHAAGII